MYFWLVLVITPVLPPISGDIGEGSRLIGFTLHYSSVHLQKFSADESTESMDSFCRDATSKSSRQPPKGFSMKRFNRSIVSQK